ncbi:hypothetical protein G3570_05515 [Balneolaceae bacterium YR4-1]|uniref:Branched-chain amino acid aminotransferase n=1 Tax=Halalkalibaculum roseum TaxID=2709311 RepID=A0A6M1SVF7_9BACT|nr:aminotransferase class IV [Halalkalibaculum roseum]NGP76078.1 hypothetical protein [Halalkalibaculum roseum]
MEDDRWVIYDGTLIRASQPAVPVESRGLMYGEGCFETLRAYQGAFFKAGDHLERLRQAAEFLDFSFPDILKYNSFRQLSRKLLEKNNLSEVDAVIRLQLWSSGDRGYGLKSNPDLHYSMIASRLPNYPTDTTLATVETRRIPSKSLPSHFKLTNNINYITAARQAAKQGANDALMLTVDEKVSETTIANLFWLKGNTVYTPSKACDLLPGITRNSLIDLLLGFSSYEFKEGEYDLEQIYSADSVWICNSLRHIIGVSRIDDHSFDSDHDFLKQLKETFENHVQSKLEI